MHETTLLLTVHSVCVLLVFVAVSCKVYFYFLIEGAAIQTSVDIYAFGMCALEVIV